MTCKFGQSFFTRLIFLIFERIIKFSFNSKFTNLWFDNMTTIPMNTAGNYDENTRTITTFGDYPNFMAAEPSKMKTETTFSEDGTGPNVYKLFRADAEGNFKLQMQVTSTRKTE